MPSFQVQQWLRQGIAAAKAGDAQRAQELLLQVVDADEYNEQAWLWLSSVVDNDADREVCLENVLAINPDNDLAKAGLVHLRTQKAAPPPPPEQPAPSVVQESSTTRTTDWWDQPQAAEPEVLIEERASAPAPVPASGEPPVKEKPRPKPPRPEPQREKRAATGLIGRLVVAVLFGLGLLTLGATVLYIVQTNPFDASGRDYAEAMRPVLADYDAWWKGAYGTLINELNDYCGPTADGWHNRDVLLNCNRYPALDCALLAAHCGGDIDGTRRRITQLARQAQQSGVALLADLIAVEPPDEVASAHKRLLACTQARLADAEWAGQLAQGNVADQPDHFPVCQIFSDAEDNVRRYVNRN